MARFTIFLRLFFFFWRKTVINAFGRRALKAEVVGAIAKAPSSSL
jgi:hypothetical protein